MRVLIVVTHLLGTGHLSRALTLSKAFAARGHEAHVVSGGLPVSNLSTQEVALHQLPPVKSDGVNFTTLLTEDGIAADQDYLENRKLRLKAILNDVSPDVLITELYPFGRRVLKAEFLSLLNAVRELNVKPKVYASIRDILAPPSKPKKALETEAVLAGYYDGVLVHSDPAKTPLEVSWPVSGLLRTRLHYTGYVAPPPPERHPDGTGMGEVLVTAGGGDVGMGLFKAAVLAAGKCPDLRWRVLVGGSDKERNINELQALSQSDNVIIEGTRPDFRQMMTGARAVVCMCGYNTAMDVLQTSVPAVFVPFAEGGETEQTLRAQSLAKQVGFSMVEMADVTADRLAKAVREICDSKPLPADPDQFNGAANSVLFVENQMIEPQNG